MTRRSQARRRTDALLLASGKDVRALRDRIRPFRWSAARAVDVRLPGLMPAARRHWEKRLNRGLNACGCFSGAAAMLVALTLYLVAALGDGAAGAGGLSGAVLAGFGVVVGATLAGKFGGIAVARLLLWRDLGRLLAQARSASSATHRKEG
ncbi:MAG TPA: hypothetical protein VGA00_10020 [Acidiferrobacterales bacterium]